MLKLATRLPDLFTSIYVEVVKALEQQRFSLGEDGMALRTTLERLTNTDPVPLMEKLG